MATPAPAFAAMVTPDMRPAAAVMARPTLPLTRADLTLLTGFPDDADRPRSPSPSPAAEQQRVAALLDAAAGTTTTTTSDSQEDTIGHAASILSASGSAELLTCIDAATGDSALHAAARSGNHAAMRALAAAFGPNLSRRWRHERLYYVFVAHANRAGDTALHAAAAGAGGLPAVVSVYRLFVRGWLADETAAAYDTAAGWPAPEDEVYDGEDVGQQEENGHVLAFVLARNKQGKDAAAVAADLGRADVVEWIEALVQRLDPCGKRYDGQQLWRWELGVLRRWRFAPEDGEVAVAGGV
ncbi:hypothetical protein B0T24DRAFT_722404 [Lasiosphaeria ovina]|uniref:Ankyrin repeat protein n=1 Tax=Lasiosphaeria ovina TaxID=92902 RepID=A0AAE0K4L9_9PEZI|nr:hypothetical protein B0T24DRAFT_722404 [Lasiosphaeria ovina]